MSLTQKEIEELAAMVGNPYRQIAFNDAQELTSALSVEDKAAVLARAEAFRAAHCENRKVTLPEAAILQFRRRGPANPAGG